MIGWLPIAYFLWGSATAHGDDRALGNALVIAALIFGVVLGRGVVWLLSRFLFTIPNNLESRLKASFSAFGVFSLPWAVAVWTNKHLGTDITLMSLEMHILWPCIVAIFFFFAMPERGGAK